MKELITVVGARPQFIKASVVSRALKEAGIRECIVHTGQHYDPSMSGVFWKELGLEAPAINLEIGSGSHGTQTAQALIKLEQFLLDRPSKPSALLVYGDTNSTLAGALAASKLHIPVIHVEAGLRSFNRDMPEEINRILTDHASNLLFCSSETGVKQLAREGITEGVYNVGDVMYDAVLTFSKIAEEKINLSDIIPFETGAYNLATIHRPSNTDNPDNLTSILDALDQLDKPVVWPVHPRNNETIKNTDLSDNLHIMPPVSYFEMLVLLKHTHKVLTDSGGLQKEAYWMKKQCITLRNETEWTETLEGGWNILTGPNAGKIIEAYQQNPSTVWKPLYGEGKASKKIARFVKSVFF